MSLWGPLENRYATQRPRKLLALDGGGIRGVLTLQVLIRMEELLREKSGQGNDFRLCNFFDYIGGTSTGAIIAAGLARGMSAQELSDFYMKAGPAMFDKSFILFRLRHLEGGHRHLEGAGNMNNSHVLVSDACFQQRRAGAAEQPGRDLLVETRHHKREAAAGRDD